MRIFEACDDVVELFAEIGDTTGLSNYGLNIKIMGVDKQKEIIKVAKASNVMEYLIKKDSVINIFVYEAALDMLTDEYKRIVVEQALSNISIDLDKDKINIETNPCISLFNMRHKYGETALNAIESGYAAIKQLEEQEKQKKEEEKLNKKTKKNND